MQLKELSERTGVSAASIKYYLREGLLPSGQTVHATRSQYSEQHVSRLELIKALRNVVELNIAQIQGLLNLADGGASRLEILAAVQRTVLGLDDYHTPRGDTHHESGDAVMHLRNWPDVPSDARSALNAHLTLMENHNIHVSRDVLDTYSHAADEIAGLDLTATTASDDVNELIKTAAIGMHLHRTLVLRLLALAQASHAIRRYEPDA